MPKDLPAVTPEVHAHVAQLAANAGLILTDAEVDTLAVPWLMLRADLAKLHDYPFGEVEPVVHFDPTWKGASA